jgi:hypothetical protein
MLQEHNKEVEYKQVKNIILEIIILKLENMIIYLMLMMKVDILNKFLLMMEIVPLWLLKHIVLEKEFQLAFSLKFNNF